MTLSDESIIKHTQNWVADVVIGCNFCPFAASALLKNKIRYCIVRTNDTEKALETMLEECAFLDENRETETTLLLFPDDFHDFETYLDLVSIAEGVIDASNYCGDYQIASFHPDYLFAGAKLDDAANYTNRSIYPMLHLLREASVENAVNTYPQPELIPDKNIDFAQKKGLEFMQKLREACKR